MYSPKISEDLIPILYRRGKVRRMPMTRLVDELIRKALASEQDTAITTAENQPDKAAA